jgi:hypothetical protein
LTRLYNIWWLLMLTLTSTNATAHSSSYDTSSSTQQLIMADCDGQIHKIAANNGAHIMVFVLLGLECPISQQCTKVVNELADKYSNNGVRFYGVIPGKNYSASEVRTFKKIYLIDFALLADTACVLTNMLHGSITPQAIVTDNSYRILYTGAIDNSYRELGRKNARVTAHYLADALTAITHKQPVAIPHTVPVGCLIATKTHTK